MNSKAPGPNLLNAVPDDPLSQLELRVAKRADELARIGGAGTGTDLAYWMRAEREVFEGQSGLGAERWLQI